MRGGIFGIGVFRLGTVLIHVHIDGKTLTLAHADFEERVRAGTVGPETPVRTNAAEAWRRAADLPGWAEWNAAPSVRVQRALQRPGVPWMTALLVGVPWRIHAWLDGEARSAAENALVKLDAAIVEHGDGWRLVSYALLHGDFQHVSSNLLFLLVIGVALEALVGPFALLVLTLVSVTVGGALSSLGSETPSIGASAADFGFLAAAAIAGARWGDLMPRRARPLFGGLIALYLVNALWNGLQEERVDNLAHLGGALGGAVLMAGLRPAAIAEWRVRNRRVLLSAVLATAVLGGSVALRPLPMTEGSEDGLAFERPAAWNVGWAATGERAWASSLGDAWLVAHTEDLGAPVKADAAEAMRARWSSLPEASFAELVADERDDVRGFVTEGTWRKDGVLRRVRAGAWSRGNFLHVVAFDVPDGDARRGDPLREVFEQVRFDALDAEDDAKGAPDTARGRVLRARVAARTGRIEDARRLLSEARALAPTDVVPWMATLEVLGAWEDPEAQKVAEEALKRFPDEHALTAAVARAQAASGASVRAADTLRAAWERWPGDRAIARAAEELGITFPDAP